MTLLSDLEYRGLLYQSTNRETLETHLASGVRSVYCGFDPTRDALTIGNLLPLLVLARFQRAGHRPIVVMGGGTGLIGDPSGKESERPIQSADDVAANVASQRESFERLLDFKGSNAAIITNNVDWLGKLSYIEALRDIGKHFSVNMMIQKDSVRERLSAREQGISYTEFSYMLLQAYDFLHLYRAHGVTIQAAGSDQWGNIVGGIDLIRRVERAETYGLTAPLVTKSDGTKFGKTESGAVWLKAARTSPYAFYQFWLNTDDADVGKYLKFYTFLSKERIEELLAEQASDPGKRTAHRALAAHVTELVHGPSGLESAQAATEALFSGNVSGLSREALEELFVSAPSVTLDKNRLAGDGADIVELLVDGAVVKSKREAREFLQQGAILTNGERATPDQKLTLPTLLHGEILLVRRGKKNWHLLRFR
jgi:tyrosyl-tRNA synthetase